MRSFLILLNCLLAGGVCFAFVSNVKSVSKEEQMVPARKEKAKKTARTQPAAPSGPAPSQDQQIRNIVSANVFNPDRSPNTGTRGQNRRVQLSLVGTFKIGKSEGAIIRVKGAVNQNRFMQMGGGMFGMPGMGMPGMGMPGAGPGAGNFQGQNQADMGAARRRNTGTGAGRGGMMSGADNRMRFSSMFRRMAGEEEESDSATTGTKQYVKVGETLTSGHTLVEVQRFKVVLSRGGSKTELLLEDPSKNQTRTASRSNVPTYQRFMQNQLNTQRQMMQMMQQMSWGMNRAMNNLNRNIQSGGGNARR